MIQEAHAAREAPTGTMKAAVISEPQKFEIEEVSIPQPGDNELLIKLEGCGVCASNIPPWEGREWFSYPMEPGALGHEGWGRVEAVGSSVTNFEVGDRVGFLSNHSYAEYDTATMDSVVKLTPALDGRPFPAEPLGCAMNIFRRSEIASGQTIAIVGIGFLGALLTQLAAGPGARVLAIARKPGSQEFASDMGAQEVIPMDDHWQIIEKVKSLTHGSFCDVVIECTGKQWPLDLAAELTKERGRLVVAGYHQDGLRQINMQLWNWRGLDVINAHERDQRIYLRGMEEAIEAVVSGRLNPDSLYTHRFPLERLGEALEMTRERPDGFMKALSTMS